MAIVNRDPNNEMLHAAFAVDIAKFRAGEIPLVTAKCGKTWAPTFFTNSILYPKEDGRPTCPDCFPPRRFAIAA